MKLRQRGKSMLASMLLAAGVLPSQTVNRYRKLAQQDPVDAMEQIEAARAKRARRAAKAAKVTP